MENFDITLGDIFIWDQEHSAAVLGRPPAVVDIILSEKCH